MRKLLLILVGFLCFASCGTSEPNPCLMSKDFIKQDLTYPDEAEFSSLDCNSETNADGTYTVLRKVTAKNAFGVKTTFVYKVLLRYNGGIGVDKNNWTLIDMQSEEYKK